MGKQVVDAASTGTHPAATPTKAHRSSSSKIDKTGSSKIDKTGSVKIAPADSVKINKATQPKINNDRPSRTAITAASPKTHDHASQPKINKATSAEPDNETPAVTKSTTTSEPATSGTRRSQAAHPKRSVADHGSDARDTTPVRSTVDGTVRSTTDAVGATLAAVDTVSKDSVAAVTRTVGADPDRSTDGPTTHDSADRDRSTHLEDHRSATTATDTTATESTATDTIAIETTATESTAADTTADTTADIDADVDTTTDAPAEVSLKISTGVVSLTDAGGDLAGDDSSGSRTTTLGELADSAVLAPTAATVSSLADLEPASTLKDATTGLLRSTTEPSRLVPQLVDTVDAVSPEPAKPVISPLVGSLGEATAQLTAPVTDLVDQTVEATAPVLPVRSLVNEVTGVVDVVPTEPVDQTVSTVLDPVSGAVADTGELLPSLPVASLPLPGLVDDGGGSLTGLVLPGLVDDGGGPLSILPIIGTGPSDSRPGEVVDVTGTGPVAISPTAPDDATATSLEPLTVAPDSSADDHSDSHSLISQKYAPSRTRVITRAAAASSRLITPPSLALTTDSFLRAATTVDGSGPAHRVSGSSAGRGQSADAGLRGHGLGDSAPTPTNSGTSGSASGGSGAGPTQPFGTSDGLALAFLNGAHPLTARHDAATVRAAHDPGFSPD